MVGHIAHDPVLTDLLLPMLELGQMWSRAAAAPYQRSDIWRRLRLSGLAVKFCDATIGMYVTQCYIRRLK